jgi:acetyl-CoA carboxylase carboxyltransferase component
MYPSSASNESTGLMRPAPQGAGEESWEGQPYGLHWSPSRSAPAAYHFIPIEPGRHQFLASIFAALGAPRLSVWTGSNVSPATFDRSCNGGLTTALAECDGRRVAIAWSDFRMNGASFGRSTAGRFAAFLRHVHGAGEAIPLIYVVNSAGVSIMEGRTAFSSAFAIWPELLRYSEDRLVLTCAVGKCLGLAPVLYGLGHYRVAVAERTHMNLTGPDVLRMFFRRSAADFEQRASAERCVERHDLVHEVVSSVEAALHLFRDVLARAAGGCGRDAARLAGQVAGGRTGALLEAFLDGPPREVVPGWCPRLRLFIGSRRGCPVGLFVNPLEQADNLVNVRTLDKYAAGLDLFRALGLPIISVLDAPGIDPRFDQSDAGNVRRILDVGEKIIRYPHGSMGVVAGRCYGGATTLAFPKVFGGSRAVALRGSQIGIMDDRIVDQVLRASPRLLAQWRAAVSARGAEFDDLLAEGSLDAVIGVADLGAEVDGFLQRCGQVPAAHLRLMPPDVVR